jgi:hypothetical protein
MYTHNLFHWFKTTNHVFNSSSLIWSSSTIWFMFVFESFSPSQ